MPHLRSCLAVLTAIAAMPTALYAEPLPVKVGAFRGEVVQVQGTVNSGITVGKAVEQGTEIRTGADGRAELSLHGDSTLAIGAGTQLLLHSMDARVLRLRVASGALRVDTRAPQGGNSRDVRLNIGDLRVRIANAEAWSDISERGGQVCVIAGTVEAQQPGSVARLDTPGQCLRQSGLTSQWTMVPMSVLQERVALLGVQAAAPVAVPAPAPARAPAPAPTSELTLAPPATAVPAPPVRELEIPPAEPPSPAPAVPSPPVPRLEVAPAASRGATIALPAMVDVPELPPKPSLPTVPLLAAGSAIAPPAVVEVPDVPPVPRLPTAPVVVAGTALAVPPTVDVPEVPAPPRPTRSAASAPAATLAPSPPVPAVLAEVAAEPMPVAAAATPAESAAVAVASSPSGEPAVVPDAGSTPVTDAARPDSPLLATAFAALAAESGKDVESPAPAPADTVPTIPAAVSASESTVERPVPGAVAMRSPAAELVPAPSESQPAEPGRMPAPEPLAPDVASTASAKADGSLPSAPLAADPVSATAPAPAPPSTESLGQDELQWRRELVGVLGPPDASKPAIGGGLDEPLSAAPPGQAPEAASAAAALLGGAAAAPGAVPAVADKAPPVVVAMQAGPATGAAGAADAVAAQAESPPDPRRWRVVLGSMPEREAAEREAERLNARGWLVQPREYLIGERHGFRIGFGEFENRDQAQLALDEFLVRFPGAAAWLAKY